MRRRTFLRAGLALPAVAQLGHARTSDSPPRLFVVDSMGSSLLALDRRTLTKTGHLPLSKRPREVVLSPNGSIAYVSIYGTGVYGNNPTPGREIFAVETRTHKIAKRISITPHQGPHGMVVAPDGRLWVTCENEGSLLVVDPAARGNSKPVAAEVPLGVKGPYWIAIAPDGSKIYASSKANPVLSVVDTKEHSLIQEIKTPGGLDGLAVATDGRRLYAASLARPSIWVIDAVHDEIVREHALDERAARLSVIPDGSGLMVTHEESGLLEVLEIPTLRRRGQVQIGKLPGGMAASTDGRTGYVAGWSTGTMSMVDLRAVRVLRTVEIGGGPDGIACWNGDSL